MLLVVTSQYLTAFAGSQMDGSNKAIRLELSYIPAPFKEEKPNFTVSIDGQ